MQLLHDGPAFNAIDLWLGHESTNTKPRCVEVNLETNERALARVETPHITLNCARTSDDLTKFLQRLQLCKVRSASAR